MKKHKIGYKLGGSFDDLGASGNIGFEILFPHIYSSYEAAEKSNVIIYARMEKEGAEVVIKLYEDKKVTETIHWNEWWKYRCYHIKEEFKNSAFIDGNSDYEPYNAKFEDIFLDYCAGRERDYWSMQYLAYWVEPVIIKDAEEK